MKKAYIVLITLGVLFIPSLTNAAPGSIKLHSRDAAALQESFPEQYLLATFSPADGEDDGSDDESQLTSGFTEVPSVGIRCTPTFEALPEKIEICRLNLPLYILNRDFRV